MEHRLIEDINKFQDIAKDWDEALVQSGEDNPFLLSDFITTWWKHHSENRKLMIYALYGQGQIVGGIPLCVQKKNFRKTLSHIGGIDANITHFFSKIKRIDFVEHLMSYLEKKENWDVFILDRVLSSNPLIKYINGRQSLGSNGFAYYIFDAGFNGLIDLTKGFDEVFEKISRRLKRYLTKGKRELNKLGELTLHKISGNSSIKRLLREYTELSVKSFRKRNKISAFEKANRFHFYEDLLVKFDMKNMLDAHRLTAGPHTLGISFGYRFGKGFKWILTAFNSDFYQLRPGHLLIEALVKEAINRGDPYFDMFYGGDVFYKQQWCQKMIPLKRIEICRNSIFNKSLILTRNKLRSNKTFMDSARKIRKTAQRIFH